MSDSFGMFVPFAGIPPMVGITPFFTTRCGGVSSGAHGGFNLGRHVEDQPERVERNRALLMTALDKPRSALRLVSQVHGQTTLLASATPWSEPPPAADALVTNQPGLVIGILIADCVPVLLADPSGRVVGAAHAGWRGALGGITDTSLEAMISLGARPQRIQALIGPSIRRSSYIVGPDVMEPFLEQSPENRRFFTAAAEAGKLHFDLPGYVRGRLLAWGLREEAIHDLERCTYAEERLFFSHRRHTHGGSGGHCGRQMGGIFLE